MVKPYKILLGATLFCTLSCHNNSTGPLHVSSVQAIAEDIQVTEAWIRVQLAPSVPHNSIVLTRDDSTIYNFYYRGNDTVLHDRRLQVKHPYIYKAYSFNDLSLEDSSAAIPIMTMDTTSHNFAWQVLTLGGLGSIISDVAIINDTSAIAVGEVYMSDSGNALYDVARWNGGNFSLSKATNASLRAVLAFSDTDIWAAGSAAYHWNGKSWHGYPMPDSMFPGYANRIWGVGSNNLYIGGTNGVLAHFDGSGWQKIQSGTTLDIRDIWGSANSKTGELEIMAVASNEYVNDDRAIFKLSGTSATRLSDGGISVPLIGVWFMPGRKYFVAGGDVFSKKNPLDNTYWWSTEGLANYSPYYRNAIRGNDLNDIFVVGDYGDILHFNGVTWKSYYQSTQLSGLYHSVAVRGNLVIAVGENNGCGAVAIGQR